ncbi:MAG: hypothetical protein E7639_06045 [Ruminococcaceae bacterium]|nr:hypothetical protein [Oscillospiraceae bacterium]
MKARFFHKRQSAPVVLEKRDTHIGDRQTSYTLVFIPHSGIYAVNVTQENAKCITASLGCGAAQAVALFEALAGGAVSPCHVSDVISDLLCEKSER